MDPTQARVYQQLFPGTSKQQFMRSINTPNQTLPKSQQQKQAQLRKRIDALPHTIRTEVDQAGLDMRSLLSRQTIDLRSTLTEFYLEKIGEFFNKCSEDQFRETIQCFYNHVNNVRDTTRVPPSRILALFRVEYTHSKMADPMQFPSIHSIYRKIANRQGGDPVTREEIRSMTRALYEAQRLSRRRYTPDKPYNEYAEPDILCRDLYNCMKKIEAR